MATYYARKSGNINANDVWATTPSGTAGAQTFVAGDVLVANSFTVTVNVSTDLGSTGEVRNDTTGGATAGGSFSLSNGVTLTANVFAGTVTCVTLASTASATIVGNLTGGSSANAYGVDVSSSGALTVTGSLTGGSGNSAYGVFYNGSGTASITGNVIGGAGVSAGGLHMQTAATTNITGNVTAAANAFGARNWAGGNMIITGTVTGGPGSTASPGALNNGIGTLTVVGTAVGGASSAGVSHLSTGTVTVTRAKGGAAATSAVGAAASTAGGITNVNEIEYGDLGASPTSGPIRLTDKTSNVAVMYRFGTTKKNLVDANASGLMPAASNVRSGTVYNGGNSVGTCAVPAASSVAFGVPVDATTGTAALTPAAVWDYLTSSATTAGSMGERLKNAATVASVGQALSDALTP